MDERAIVERQLGRPPRAFRRVVARCPLEPRRSVYLIEAAGRCFLVGVGDGPMSLLAELDASRVPAVAASPAFPDVLARVLGKPRAGAPSSGDGS